jgi:hypothetical protein
MYLIVFNALKGLSLQKNKYDKEKDVLGLAIFRL